MSDAIQASQSGAARQADAPAHARETRRVVFAAALGTVFE
jgi:hypothetical protein